MQAEKRSAIQRLNANAQDTDKDVSISIFFFPTPIEAKEFSRLRLNPMIRDCPTLKTQ